MSPEALPSAVRVGWGFDAHPLNGDPPLILGGVIVSDEIGVVATSDGDVVAHAVTDAVLGAIVAGDIGEHFPSDDPRWRGAASLHFVEEAVRRAGEAGWRVSHADVTVLAEQIRVAPHREQIRTMLSAALGAESGSVSVKATTTDGLGFIGRGEGVAAVAVVTVTALP
jgi:2-C-methyl-D-erythritol 2,4-cyclodiphosphate synthase